MKTLINRLLTVLKEKNPLNTDGLSAYESALCFGVCRQYLALAEQLKNFLKKPFKPKDFDIHLIMLCGAYQLQNMDRPAHAIVNECVEFAKKSKKVWAAGLINKYCRDIAKAPQPFTPEQTHPDWLIKKIKMAYPENWQATLKANDTKAPLTLRVNHQQTSLKKYCHVLEQNGVCFETLEGYPFALNVIPPQPIEKLPGFREGWFSVQDVAGQRLGNFIDLPDKATVWDACSAPGSKTTLLLEQFPTIQLTATDISDSRLNQLRENLLRLKLPSITVQATDALQFKANFFDCIILDAPCSGTGVIRRHPDIKLLRNEQDIQSAVKLQSKLLHHCFSRLKPGGTLIYSTCSILPEENSEVISSFCNQTPSAKLEQSIQLLPGQTDGFYYAKLTKTSQRP